MPLSQLIGALSGSSGDKRVEGREEKAGRGGYAKCYNKVFLLQADDQLRMERDGGGEYLFKRSFVLI